MTEKIAVVIGANYGDEGKGKIVDYLCSKYIGQHGPDGAVIRFQGGCQCGHRVVAPDGTSHVFSSFGSGTLLGLPTFLGPKVVCNPFAFLNERKALMDMGLNPTVKISGDCLITTPYDVALNRSIERARGKGRHGSVGVGFGETIERYETGDCSLSFIEAKGLPRAELLRRLQKIADYAIEKAKKIQLPEGRSLPTILLASHNGILESTYNVIKDFTSVTEFWEGEMPRDFAILEGGQGLLIGMEYGYYPHITRSKTGVEWAVDLMTRIGAGPINEAVYVTRVYTTRHGAGPFPEEVDFELFKDLREPENKTDEFQGPFRFGYLDGKALGFRIEKDLSKLLLSCPKAKMRLAVTCLDHLLTCPESFLVKNRLTKIFDEFYNYIADSSWNIGRQPILSYGESRENTT